VDELDRVFDRQDVPPFVLRAEVDHRRQRGRLTRARSADHQDQASLAHDDFVQFVRQTQLGNGKNPVLDVPADRRRGAALVEQVYPESAGAGHLERDIEFKVFFVVPELILIQDRADECVRGILVDCLVVQGRHSAFYVYHRRRVDRYEQVRCLFPNHVHEKISEFHCSLPILRSQRS
jgi:hypothetical protein